jgi:hypothetical protein
MFLLSKGARGIGLRQSLKGCRTRTGFGSAIGQLLSPKVPHRLSITSYIIQIRIMSVGIHTHHDHYYILFTPKLTRSGSQVKTDRLIHHDLET